MKRAYRVKELLRLARALDYEKDPNPEHWKTINGAKVHVDKNGKYDGGAGGKFNGNYHFGGADWKDKKAKIESLANAFNQAVAQKQAQANAQGNGQGNTSAQNVASKATNTSAKLRKEAKRDKITSKNWESKINNATSGEEWVGIYAKAKKTLEKEIKNAANYSDYVALRAEQAKLSQRRLPGKFEDYTPKTATEYQAKFLAMGIETNFARYKAGSSGYTNMKAFDDNLKKYPKFRQFIKTHGIKLLNTTKAVHGNCRVYGDGRMEIHLNSSDLNNPEQRKAAARAEISSKFKMPATEENYLVYTIHHETGHAIENAAVFERIGRYDRGELGKIRAEIIDIAKNAGNLTEAECLRELSDYGQKNDAEFFAECYANYRCGSPNVLGDAIGVWLERWSQT